MNTRYSPASRHVAAICCARRHLPLALALGLTATLATGCFSSSSSSSSRDQQADVQAEQLALGEEVFRFETFGNERFWTDVMRLPQGLAGAGVTPLDALALGLNVNAGALSDGTAAALLDALDQIEDGTDPADTVLADPAVTLTLINEGAVIGVVPIGDDEQRLPLGSEPDHDSDIEFTRVGVSCALCHAGTDGSVVEKGFAGPGSVGLPTDGRIAEGLDVGAIFATAENPLAYLPFLQLAFDNSLDGATLGKTGFPGIPADGSVTELTDAAIDFLTGTDSETGERHYPVTHFIATPDGIGNPTYFPPFFRTDLAAPWGSAGAFDQLSDFNNLVYTVAFDPTILVTDNGRAFLNAVAGPIGDEIADRYDALLRATTPDELYADGDDANDVFPLVRVERDDIGVGSLEGVVGVRVAESRLDALQAYTDQLPAPPAPDDTNQTLAELGEAIFMTPRSMGGANCVACHTANPNQPVEFDQIRPITQLYRDYEDDILVLFERSATLGITNVQTTLAGPVPSYDLSLVVLDASLRGEPVSNPGAKPGIAKPLLLGINDKTALLHDGSIGGADISDALDLMFNPDRREANEPHAFFFPGRGQENVMGGGDGSAGRAALVEYMRTRSTD